MTQELEQFSKLEPWKKELANFVIEAAKQGKRIKSTYDPGLVFTPEELAEQLCNGKFVWGVTNWRMV